MRILFLDTRFQKQLKTKKYALTGNAYIFSENLYFLRIFSFKTSFLKSFHPEQTGWKFVFSKKFKFEISARKKAASKLTPIIDNILCNLETTKLH